MPFALLVALRGLGEGLILRGADSQSEPQTAISNNTYNVALNVVKDLVEGLVRAGYRGWKPGDGGREGS
jgi:hypothetical protein